MVVFFFLLIVPIVIQHVSIKGHYIDNQKKNIRAITFFFVFLTLLVMLRHESVGNDTRNYIYYFDFFSHLGWDEVGTFHIEIGYSYFNKIVSLFTEEPQIFLAAAAFAVSAMMYPTYKRLCVDPSLTIVTYVTLSTFVMMFSGIRQMIAIAIGFLAYEFTRKKKLIPFIICVVAAISFHTSAFMLAFMYPLYYAKITKKWLWAVIPSMAVIFAFNKPIFTFLGLFVEAYTEYDASITQTGAYTMLFLFILFTVFSYIIPDESKLNEETIGLRNFLLISVVIQMFAPLHTLAMRMNYYYIIFIPLLLPKIIEARSDRWKQVAMTSRHVMVAFFLVYFFFNAYSTAGENSCLHVFPYYFLWETAG